MIYTVKLDNGRENNYYGKLSVRKIPSLRRMNTRRNSRSRRANTRKNSRKQNGGARKSDCKQTHVLVRDGCTTYKRVVHSHGKGAKTIKWGGNDVSLSTLRGKFRYLDGTVRA
jgi:hypothetical protein